MFTLAIIYLSKGITPINGVFKMNAINMLAIKAVQDTIAHFYAQSTVKNIVITDNASLVPSTGKAIFEQYINNLQSNAPFYVLASHDNCILGKIANEQYRLLHDIDHALNYSNGQGTTALRDEIYLNGLFANRVFKHLVNPARSKIDLKTALTAYVILIIDLIEQANFYSQKRNFIDNQIQFVIDRMDNEYKYIFDLINNDTNAAQYELATLACFFGFDFY